MTDERLIEVKSRAATEFFKIPGVTGVGLGARERDGRRTGELVIKVYVRQKRPPEELTPGETLPPRFEGIGVDVGVLGDPKPEMGTPLPPEAPMGSEKKAESETDTTRYNPLIGGASIQADLPGKGPGTAGSIWRDVPDPATPNAPAKKVWLLTNYHVLALPQPVGGPRTPPAARRPPVGTRVGHPASTDPAAKRLSNLIGTYTGLGDKEDLRDAALVELDRGTKYRAEIKCIGVISSETYAIDPLKDLLLPKPYPVRKYGTRTRLTGGTVEAVHMRLNNETIDHTNLMLISPNPNPEVKPGKRVFFADEGDSGAAIVNDDNKIVALHALGVDAAPNLHKSYSFPIVDVVKRFDEVDHVKIQPATAVEVGFVQEVPPATPFAPPHGLEHVMAGAASETGALARVDADLVGSEAGRRLRALWADHHAELLDLVRHRRRVAATWQRGGGPVILHTLIRMAADPAVAMPATINGVPPMDRLANLHAVFHANASPELRRALDHALAAVPDPATLTYDQLLAAIATR